MNFNEDSGDWQYMSSPIIADGSYSSISIYALYYLNLNTAYFDGIQLYREEYGQSYQYDSNGNVTSTVDLAKQNTRFDYNTQNDLVKSTDPKCSFFTYEYSADGKRRLTKATSAENVVYSFEYDSYGNPRKAKVSGATYFMESSSTYTASGAYADTITDSSGNSVSYAYNESKGTLTSVTDPKGKTATYSYDSNTDALTGVSKTVDGSVVTNGYTYENDRLKTIAHNGFSYTFGYDALGNSTTVSAGSQTLITNSFDLRTGRLLESTYGNGHRVATDYDNLDRVATYKVWNSATGQYEVKFRYGYDASGNLGYLEDVVNSASYRYVYDLADRLVKISGSDGSSLTNGFDVNNNVSSITEKGNGTSFTTGYTYDKDNRPIKVTLQNGATGTNTYDSLGRVSLSRVTIGAAIFDVAYTYLAGVNGSTTARVATISNSNGNAISYTYDKNGNIETITEGSKLTKYYYNELNEVIREDNGNLNKSITYTYDAGGNILTKKEYAYTTGVLGTVLSSIPYTYGDANWKDKLTAYNGKAISYDAIGNPLSYDGWTYTWENGRQLKSLGNGSTSLAFKYDDAGVRTEKTVGGVTTKYTLFGDKVSFETTGSDKIHYSYDASGNLFSMNLNGSEYYYTRNAQGDITGLIDGAKNQVVSYTYDTWGKLLSTTGSLAGTLGAKNPYRYRGYRYDTETGLYYLQSRYYNPDWGRFVNADAYGGKAGTLLSHNMFAYALNNPVNMDDPSGHFPKWATGLLTIAGGISAMVAGAALGATVGWTGIGAAAAGFLIVNGATTVLSGTAQFSNSAFNTTLHEENILRTVLKTTGRVLGGSTGEKVSAVMYDAADTAASIYSIVGGGSTALSKTVSALGKKVSITRTFTLFAQPSKFTNPYVVKMALGMERLIHLPKPWFRAVNGIGALADGLLSGKRLHGGLINIFGGR